MTLGMQSNDISLAHYGRIDFLGVVGGRRLILADILAGLLLLVSFNGWQGELDS